MSKKLLLIELTLLVSLLLDYFIHYLPVKIADAIFLVMAILAIPLFKPYMLSWKIGQGKIPPKDKKE